MLAQDLVSKVGRRIISSLLFTEAHCTYLFQSSVTDINEAIHFFMIEKQTSWKTEPSLDIF